MRQLPWLIPGEDFPPTSTALQDPNGLLAAGGDLSTETLLRAYRAGIFPWYSAGDPLLWWSPAPRTILWPRQVHVSRSLAKCLRQQRFDVRSNTRFADVMQACATVKRAGQRGTWIDHDMQEAYLRLHQAGLAESVEVFAMEELVGGLYGVRINGMFFGESMFHLVSNASKVALVHLCRRPGIRLIDCQMPTPHLLSMGARQMSRDRFEHALSLALSSGAEPIEENN
jgi:leucyl/phenylalanyl-tRNA--protein transferase